MSNLPTKKPFGVHYTCACCGTKMLTACIGLRHPKYEGYMQPYAEDPEVIERMVTELKQMGWEEARLCGHCGDPEPVTQ